MKGNGEGRGWRNLQILFSPLQHLKKREDKRRMSVLYAHVFAALRRSISKAKLPSILGR
jgi:hypothetical protein